MTQESKQNKLKSYEICNVLLCCNIVRRAVDLLIRSARFRPNQILGFVAKESSFQNVPTGRYVSGRLVRLYDFS